MPAKPTSPLRATSIRLPEAMFARIDALAESTGLSQTDIIRMGMLRALDMAERDPAELLRIGGVHGGIRPPAAAAVQPFANFANASARLNEREPGEPAEPLPAPTPYRMKGKAKGGRPKAKK